MIKNKVLNVLLIVLDKKKVFVTFLVVIILVIAVIFFKNKYYCNNIKGIEISDSVLWGAYDNNYNYCTLVRSSFEKKNSSVIKLTLLYYGDGLSYEHGEIVIKLIKHLGEKYYLSELKNNKLSLHEKRIIYSVLSAGIELMYEFKDLKVIFPLIYEYLKEEI